MLRDSEEKEDHLSNRVVLELLLLKPITSIASCKRYIPRVIIIIVVMPEIVYIESKEMLAELPLELQRHNPFVW